MPDFINRKPIRTPGWILIILVVARNICDFLWKNIWIKFPVSEVDTNRDDFGCQCFLRTLGELEDTIMSFCITSFIETVSFDRKGTVSSHLIEIKNYCLWIIGTIWTRFADAIGIFTRYTLSEDDTALSICHKLGPDATGVRDIRRTVLHFWIFRPSDDILVVFYIEVAVFSESFIGTVVIAIWIVGSDGIWIDPAELIE